MNFDFFTAFMATAKTYSFMRNFLFVTGLIYLVNFLMDGRLDGVLGLVPSAVFEKMEFWRIVTFPFSYGSFEGVMLFAVVFYFFGSKVEQLLPKGILPALLILLIAMQGIAMNLIFWNSSYSIAGMEGIAIFSLTLFTLTHYRARVKFLSFPSFRGSAAVLLIFSAWILAKAVNSLLFGNSVIYIATANIGFGFFTAMLIHFQIRFLNKMAAKRKAERKVPMPDPEELSLAMIANREMKKYYQQQSDDVFLDDFDFELTEERLNEILDKISVSGQESLTIEERKFLRQYSKNL